MGPLDDQVVRADSLTAAPGGIDVKVYSHWYRALPLSCIARLALSIDGRSDLTAVTVNGVRRPVAVMIDSADEYWFTSDPLILHVTGEFPGDEHRVVLELGLTIPYILTGTGRTPLLSSSRSDKTLKVTRD